MAHTCKRCGEPAPRSTRNRLPFCLGCTSLHGKGRDAAIAVVGRAVKAGALPRADGLTCVDCGKPAVDYDHRDYSKPLEVVPVCRSCNQKRGPAS